MRKEDIQVLSFYLHLDSGRLSRLGNKSGFVEDCGFGVLDSQFSFLEDGLLSNWSVLRVEQRRVVYWDVLRLSGEFRLEN